MKSAGKGWLQEVESDTWLTQRSLEFALRFKDVCPVCGVAFVPLETSTVVLRSLTAALDTLPPADNITLS